jgi:Na+/H+-translocating membrane pyrophosphatase
MFVEASFLFALPLFITMIAFEVSTLKFFADNHSAKHLLSALSLIIISSTILSITHAFFLALTIGGFAILIVVLFLYVMSAITLWFEERG